MLYFSVLWMLKLPIKSNLKNLVGQLTDFRPLTQSVTMSLIVQS